MTDSLVGLKVTAVRPMTATEMEREGWHDNLRTTNPTAIVFEDGTVVYASQDEEGNGPGCLFGVDKKSQTFYIMARRTT